ncbi:hypothetical protein B0H15DRAFT_796273 [Mycena belliarum]|uniref:Uncharacterized protein n=1 Tax=Mycena belliarum TaxID=1033014 RepID=A0AAD6UFP4_9AGAR|nr:hypothetical protein B0H15DRAFT_796273 [Mycena belliae]
MASTDRAVLPQPAFPEDIERTINEVLLRDTRAMCGTMSLVASRFNIWTKPIAFHTVMVHRRNNWMERIIDWLLPNAAFVRILVLDMPSSQADERIPLPAEELSLIRRLLQASEHVAHLAVTWNIWSDLQNECCTLRIEGLYLIWDDAYWVPSPSLAHLKYPTVLYDLTISAPADLDNPTPYRSWGMDYVPNTNECFNLAYVTYASTRHSDPILAGHIKRYKLILVGSAGLYRDDVRAFRSFNQRRRKRDPEFSVQIIQHWHQVLGEWVARMEGRESLLIHPRD